MSKLYDNVEPAVIDESLLIKCAEEQGESAEVGNIAKSEGIDLKDVSVLRLDDKRILRMEFLWQCKNLTKLQLDNNTIEKIEGLDELVNLIWLDLSFNYIEKVEGLDKLEKLMDLTLCNNRIVSLDNMDNLKSLHVFSVGNNRIEDLSNALYLRRFTNLRSVNFKGNPICENKVYKAYVIAFLPHLVYFDHELIEDSSRIDAKDKYEISIQEIEHNEDQAEIKQKEHIAEAEELTLHKDALVENLSGSSLFDSMYAEDPEGQIISTMPGVEDFLSSYKENFARICGNIFDYGLKRHEERLRELSIFKECVADAKAENKLLAIQYIDNFLDHKKNVWNDFNSLTDQDAFEKLTEEFLIVINVLWENLMVNELKLVDQLEDVTKDFERNIDDIVTSFCETVQNYITQCRELEKSHMEKLMEIALNFLEVFAKNEVDDEISEDLRVLFVDRDTITNAVTSSHDVHLVKIDNQEDDMTTRINVWKKNILQEIHSKEIERNRSRVMEISSFADFLREECDTVEINFNS